MNRDQQLRHSAQMEFIETRSELANALVTFDLFQCADDELRTLTKDVSSCLESIEALERRHKIRAINSGGAR